MKCFDILNIKSLFINKIITFHLALYLFANASMQILWWIFNASIVFFVTFIYCDVKMRWASSLIGFKFRFSGLGIRCGHLAADQSTFILLHIGHGKWVSAQNNVNATVDRIRKRIMQLSF